MFLVLIIRDRLVLRRCRSIADRSLRVQMLTPSSASANGYIDRPSLCFGVSEQLPLSVSFLGQRPLRVRFILV